jgi:NAD(P)-dependent dehydrogenase (short-subunit alcohol dehydrogenase family)
MASPPAAIVVQPGTSPVEDQEKVNPINSSCTVLVVGANRGIGLEFVKQCLERGATVIASHRSDEVPETLRDLQSEYDDNKLRPLQIDLTSESSIEDAASKFQAMDIGSLTHIIHNAGIYLPGTSFDGTARGPRDAAPKVTKEVLMKTYEINTIAPLLIAQNFVPLMGKRSDSLYPVLAMLSSKVGSVDDNGSGGAYAYRSSKSALNNIAKSISIDLGDEIRVALLHPGYVRTDMTNGNGFIDTDESVSGMLNAIEATDASTGFRFVDYKACLIPW